MEVSANDVLGVLDTYGFPILFVLGLLRGWFHIGPGVDPSWKDIALRSIEANERQSHALQAVSEQRGRGHSRAGDPIQGASDGL